MLPLILTGLVSGFVNGIFASGGGVISVLALTMLLKTERKKAHATTVLVILTFSLLSMAVYGFKGNIDLRLSFLAGLGGALGGAIGAYLLKAIPVKYVSKIFGTLMIISAARMFFI